MSNFLLGILRYVLGKFVLLINFLWPVSRMPEVLTRSPEEQQRLNQICSRLKLYQFESCPFCVKVRRALKRLNLNIELRDAKNNLEYRKELESQGGMIQVPCLRITEESGAVRWLYESDDIITYLTNLTRT